MTQSLFPAIGSGLALLSLAPFASAQIDWVEFSQNNSLISDPNGVVLFDGEEKDFAWGDLDQDGWTDLVIVRKQGWDTTGRRANVLLMNESGVLTDRTATYATASDVPGDLGFLTPTNDRDVVLADVNGDSWLDVVTAANYSPGQPKHISHPRVYVNLGEDGGGNWLGLRFEEARTPQIQLAGSGTNYFPFFSGVDAGDVTGDGAVDLYFTDFDVSGFSDVNDRLFINDGTGHFADESAARMITQMLDSSYGISTRIVDMNGNGVQDIVKNTGAGTGGPEVTISYNDPANEGFFNIMQEAPTSAPYHVSVGDLNGDQQPDLIVTDDGPDQFVLHTGVDTFGRVIWSNPVIFDSPDQGFGGDSLAVDLDQDGWNEAIIADVDVQIPGCTRRMKIHHNRGGVVGGAVELGEESGGGFTTATGMIASDLQGTHDVAAFDIDNDGDLDLVLGRCFSTDVWVNQLSVIPIGTPYCSPAVPNSSGFAARTRATGSTLVLSNDVTLTADFMPVNKFGYFITSQTAGLHLNPAGSTGNLCLDNPIGRYNALVFTSGPTGSASIEIDLTNMPGPVQDQVLPGDTWHFSCWFRDIGGTSNFTDGLGITFE